MRHVQAPFGHPNTGRTAMRAACAGIRQVLDIGTGLPTADNTHEVAPQCRIAYVDNDPIVLAHARALLTTTPEGATAYVEADLRDTSTVLAGRRERWTRVTCGTKLPSRPAGGLPG